MEFNNEEDVKNLVKSTYRPVTAPAELKKQLLERLTLEDSGTMIGIARPLWERPWVLVPVLAAVTSGLIGYGAWLSMNVAPTLLP